MQYTIDKNEEELQRLKGRFIVVERSNEALRDHVRNLIEVMTRLNAAVVAWKSATLALAISLVAAVIALIVVL